MTPNEGRNGYSGQLGCCLDSLDMLKEEASGSCMTLNKDKCEVLPVGRKHQCSSPALLGPGGQLNMGPVKLCSLAARMINNPLK